MCETVDRILTIGVLISKSLEFENASTAEIQKFEKELFSLEPISEDECNSCHEKIETHLISPISEKSLKRITVLLERRFKRFFQSSANALMNVLLDTIQLWLKEDLNVSQNQVHLSIRVMLQIIQYFWNEDNMKDFNTNRAEELLFEIIKNNDCALESIMLAGTCLVRLIFAKCLHLESSVSNCVSFLISFVANNDVTELTRLVFLTGLLNSGNNSVFLHKVEGIPLILFIFPLILELCEKNINHIFQSFQLLLIWLGVMKKNVHNLHNNSIDFSFNAQNNIPNLVKSDLVCDLLHWWKNDFESKFGQEYGENDYFFQGSSRLFNHVFIILTVNWENFIRGVPELVKDCFNVLLEVHLAEAQLKDVKTSLIEKLVQYYLLMPWTSKAKYPPLAILISHYGVKNLLSSNPTLPFNLTETLYSNPLTSSGGDLYRAMLKKYRDEELDSNVLVTSWQQTWMKPFCTIIESDDSYLQQNLFRHWFPHTLAIFPETYSILIEEFSQNSDKEGFQIAAITLMSQARQSGILNWEDFDINIIHENLFHINESIRMQAFTLICSTRRKADPLSYSEMTLIEEFLVYNLNIDNASFRQQLINQMKNVFVRVRDSCVTWIREENKNGDKIPQLNESLKFIDKVFWLIIYNLHPGARYQRRQTCLDLLSTLLDALIALPDANKRKGGVPVKAPVLVAYAQKNGMWQFTCEDVFYSLLCCLQDFMNEIKFLAVQILQKYFCDIDFLENEDNVTKLRNQGFKWLNSPKPHVCESGSLLINYILKCKLRNKQDACALECLAEFIMRLNSQFSAVKANLLSASKSSPIYGVILALRTYINENEWSNSSLDCEKFTKLMHELIELISDIINYVLSILASKSNSNCQAPSFEDMGLAIENILDAEGINMDDDNPSLSLEHQLILSCCWLTLKESSFLLSKLVIKVPFTYPSKDGILNPSLVRLMTDDLVNILIGCRHRGAIEACSVALGELCEFLASEQLPEYREIPKSILNSALGVIRTPQQTSSITRRSAGFPLLFIAIISNEVPQRKRFLLDSCITNLITIASTSLVLSELDVTDLPQTHALHIIRALVHDSGLSQAVLPHMTDVIKLCIESFSSSIWSLRNAALQLFGSLVPRLLGQKKVKDESSQHNSITAETLFHRYPDFKLYLINYLQRLSCHINPAEPGLVPILSLLSKLSTSSDGVNLEEDFSLLLDPFIGSSFLVIRKLTANAYIATSNKSYNKILEIMIEKLNSSLAYQIGINYIHGVALIILQLLESSEFSSDQLRSLELCLRNCYSIITKQFGCYFVKALLLKILSKFGTKLNIFLSILENEKNSVGADAWKPGRSEWVKEITFIKLKTSSQSEILELTRKFLRQESQDEILCCLKYIKLKTKSDVTPELNLYFQEEIIKLLCNNPHAYHVEQSLIVLQNLIGNKHFMHPQINSPNFLNFMKCAIEGTFGTLSAASTTVFMGYFLNGIVEKEDFLKNSDLTDLLNVWCKQIYSYSDPRMPEDLRIKSAEALNLYGASLLHRLTIACDNQVRNWLLNIFHAGVALLTDENGEIRQKAAEFASSLPRSGNFYKFLRVNHNYGLEIFCNYFASKFGESIEFLDALWTKISNPSSTMLLEEFIKEDKQCILFEQDDINIYAEQFHITKIYSSILSSLLIQNKNCSSIKTWVQEKINVVSSDAKSTALYLATNLSSISDLPCINALSCYKPFICVYQLMTQISLLLNSQFINIENKHDLQNVHLKLKSFCIASWIT